MKFWTRFLRFFLFCGSCQNIGILVKLKMARRVQRVKLIKRQKRPHAMGSLIAVTSLAFGVVMTSIGSTHGKVLKLIEKPKLSCF